MDLTPIVNQLEFEGLGTAGVDLFVNFMPMEAKNAIMVRASLSGTDIDPALPGYYKGKFTAVVRSVEFTAGMAKAEEVMRALTIYEAQLDTMYIRQLYPCTLPVYFPLSDGSLYEIQISFDIVFIGQGYGRPD